MAASFAPDAETAVEEGGSLLALGSSVAGLAATGPMARGASEGDGELEDIAWQPQHRFETASLLVPGAASSGSAEAEEDQSGQLL